MNFTYEGADLSKTIKHYERNGCNYSVTYLDGSQSNYYCSNEKEEEKIQTIMIEQALERHQKMAGDNIDGMRGIYLFGSIVSTLAVIASLFNDEGRKAILLPIIADILFVKCYINSKCKINELKKYDLFMQLKDDLDIINNSKFLKCVEFDTMYQTFLNINTVDQYSLGDLNIISRKLTETKRNNIDKK